MPIDYKPGDQIQVRDLKSDPAKVESWANASVAADDGSLARGLVPVCIDPAHPLHRLHDQARKEILHFAADLCRRAPAKAE